MVAATKFTIKVAITVCKKAQLTAKKETLTTVMFGPDVPLQFEKDWRSVESEWRNVRMFLADNKTVINFAKALCVEYRIVRVRYGSDVPLCGDFGQCSYTQPPHRHV
jgi:hypothetical protein